MRTHLTKVLAVLLALAAASGAACNGTDGGPVTGGTGGDSVGGTTGSGSGGSRASSGGATALGGTTTGEGGNTASGGAASGGSAKGGSAKGGSAMGGRATGGSPAGGTSSSGGSSTTTGGATASTGGSSGNGGTTSACGVTGPSAPFPVLTSYAAKDGGFGYVITRNVSDATSGPVAIFRPSKYGQNGLLHPIVVWGNGSGNTVDTWSFWLRQVAAYGFVVVAPEQSQVTAAQMRAAVDYMIRLANDGTSGDCGKVDTTKIGSTGYSLGTMGAISLGSDARTTATFFFSGGFGGGGAASIKQPWAAITGELDTVATPATAQSFLNGTVQPGFYAVLTGKDHAAVPITAAAQQAYLAFLRWRLMGEAAGKAMFVGASCTICTDKTNFMAVYSKGYDTL